ncbi:hypothetical protein KUH03_28425 [Sphingobacterium sp. E70]|uniref:hypothetical protein n=1 Tax=Sphingobacterium sp. E70 TaxID=2853439 RepID=UPI00211C743F|nr:hypothetical protein [Sphingobacterium sp. E70]ULT23132.1 hypothetical protein KUH03_28425 [Sphingobacterium sp. E70]
MPTHHFKHVVLGLLMTQGLVHLDVQAQSKQIPIETRSNALVLEYDSTKTLKMLYYGEKLSDSKEYATIASGYRQLTDYSGLSNAAYTLQVQKIYWNLPLVLSMPMVIAPWTCAMKSMR